ncbi:hypothetical protein [Gottschalkia purinilytica]|nr:hypothetical protein [Gottschalkia purinilytica]
MSIIEKVLGILISLLSIAKLLIELELKNKERSFKKKKRKIKGKKSPLILIKHYIKHLRKYEAKILNYIHSFFL